MKPKTYNILERAIEEGVEVAWKNRVFKYEDNPSDERVVEIITNSIMLAIDEVFTFEDDHL
jgi:hypothetical protein